MDNKAVDKKGKKIEVERTVVLLTPEEAAREFGHKIPKVQWYSAEGKKKTAPAVATTTLNADTTRPTRGASRNDDQPAADTNQDDNLAAAEEKRKNAKSQKKQSKDSETKDG